MPFVSLPNQDVRVSANSYALKARQVFRNDIKRERTGTRERPSFMIWVDLKPGPQVKLPQWPMKNGCGSAPIELDIE